MVTVFSFEAHLLVNTVINVVELIFTLDMLLCYICYKVVINYHQHNYLCFIGLIKGQYVESTGWSCSGHYSTQK